MEKQKGQTIYISLHTHTNNSSGRIHNLKTLTLFAPGERERQKRKNVYCTFTMDFEPQEGTACFKMNKLNLNLNIEKQGKRSHFQCMYFKYSVNVKKQAVTESQRRGGM